MALHTSSNFAQKHAKSAQVGGALGEIIETVRNRSIYEMMRKGGMVSADFTTSKALDDRLRAILASGVREEGKQSGIRPGGVLSQ